MTHLAENSRRMRDYNRALAHARYLYIPGQPGSMEPEPPMLLQEDGSERRYRPAVRPAERLIAPEFPVGPGPDQWGYWHVAGPDNYGVGDFFHDPRSGGVYCRVEAPLPGGDFQPVWLRVT